MVTLCQNNQCSRKLFSQVHYCPFCGVEQKQERKRQKEPVSEQSARTSAPHHQRSSVAHNGDQPQVTETATISGSSTGAATGDPVTLAPATSVAQTQSVANLATRRASILPPQRWIVGILAVILLLAGLVRLAGPDWPGPGYQSVACGSTIAAELTILIDLPAQLDPSTRAELFVRLTRALDTEHSGVRRISVFSTRSRQGDSATPIFSECSATTPLGSMLGAHGLAPQFKAAIIDKVEQQLTLQESAASVTALTQVVADLSVSQYLRAPENTFMVFSDLIDKSTNFNLLTCDNTQDMIRSYRATHAGAVERPAFRNTAVDLNVVPDMDIGPATARCRKAFWHWYFSDSEGESARLAMNFLPGRLKKKVNTKGNHE